MQRTHWIKGMACLGAAMTLSLASCVTLEDATASGMCGEKEMAGISLALDRYYFATYAQEAEFESSEVVPVSQAATLSAIATQSAVTTQAAIPTVPEVTAAPVETTAPVPATPSPKKKEKKEKVSKRYRTLGISIANDYVNIRKNADTSSKILGKLYKGSSAKILANDGKWVRIQSGDVTGYIKKEFLAIGADAQSLADKYGIKHASLKPGTITLKVRAKTSTKSTVLTLIPEDERYSVIGETPNWAKIIIDDGTEGYVAKEFVDISVSYKKAVSAKEEKEKIARRKAAEKAQKERLEQLEKERAQREREEREAAQQKEQERKREAAKQEAQKKEAQKKAAEKKEEKKDTKKQESTSKKSSSSLNNNSQSNSKSSQKSSYSSSNTGAEIANYAKKFVGNPYVYGGSSLTNGTDCSGFTMSIYAQFGYSIPRTSRAQSAYGKSVSLSNLKPGDLIFYKSGSTVGHVALYIGGGKVVHASNPSDGIKISNINYRRPCSARRIVD